MSLQKLKFSEFNKKNASLVNFLKKKIPKNIAIPYFVELLILVAQMKALVEQSSTKIFPKFKSENFLRYANFKNLLN